MKASEPFLAYLENRTGDKLTAHRTYSWEGSTLTKFRRKGTGISRQLKERQGVTF